MSRSNGGPRRGLEMGHWRVCLIVPNGCDFGGGFDAATPSVGSGLLLPPVGAEEQKSGTVFL